MEPQEAIAAIENDIRGLVEVVFASSAWQSTLGSEKVGELRSRLIEEQKRRKPAVVPTNLLSYTHFYELRTILTKSWQLVSPALGEKRTFEVWAGQIEDFRNAPAHSRELLPYERAMLEGIAGAIRTKITVYRSSKAPDMSFYPIIESISDSFGNSVGQGELDPLESHTTKTGLVVRPGQLVRFHARGWDPQGRELRWNLKPNGIDVTREAVGEEVDLVWAVGDDDVGINRFVELNMMSDGQFHRHGRYDQRVSFHYRVDPPFGAN